MGAGYRTARPVFVDDKMLKLPWQLMGEVVKSHEEGLEEAVVNPASDFVEKLGNLDSLSADRQQANQLVAGYEEKIDQVTQDIMQDPLNYRRKSFKVKNLQRELAKDMQRGKWAAISGRHQGYMNDVKRIQELKAEDGYTDDYKARLMQDALAKADELQYNDEDGTYNQYQAAEALAMPEMNKWVDERLEDAIPDFKSVKRDELSGGWIVTTKNEVKEMSDMELADILNNSMQADTQTMNAINQRARLGMQGFTDVSDGNNLYRTVGTQEIEVTNPNTGKKEKTTKLAFANNMLGNAFRAGVSKYGFREVKEESSLDENQYSLIDYRERVRRAGKKFDAQEEMDTFSVIRNESMDTFFNSLTDETYDQAIEDTDALITSTVGEAAQMLENIYGSTVDESITEDMMNGDFSAMEEAGIPRETVDKLRGRYRAHHAKKIALEGIERTFEYETRQEYNNLEDNDPGNGMSFDEYFKMKKDASFDSYLNSHGTTDVNREYSWSALGVDAKQQEQLQKQFVDGRLYSLAEIDFNGEKTTIQKLINDGKIIPEQKKLGVSKDNPNYRRYQQLKQMSPEERREKGVAREFYELQASDNVDDPTIITYRFADGDGYINLDVSEKSLMPATSLDGDGDIDLGFQVNINGRSSYGKVSTDKLTSRNIETFKNANGKNLQYKMYLAKMSNTNGIQSSHMPGYTMNVKSKNIITPDGVEHQLDSESGMLYAMDMLHLLD